MGKVTLITGRMFERGDIVKVGPLAGDHYAPQNAGSTLREVFANQQARVVDYYFYAADLDGVGVQIQVAQVELVTPYPGHHGIRTWLHINELTPVTGGLLELARRYRELVHE